MIAAILATLIARELLHVAWETFANRHKPGNVPTNRTYRKPCGPRCKAKMMSNKGWRVRTQESIQRAAERVHRAVTRYA